MYAEHIAIRVLSQLGVKVFSTVYSASSCHLKQALQKPTDNLLISEGKISTAHSSINSLDLGCAIKSLPAPPTRLT